MGKAKPADPHEELAAELGGTYVPSRWFRTPRIEFRVHGLSATLNLPGMAEDSPSSTHLSIDMKGRSPGALKIYPEGFGTSIARFFGAQDIRIGDRRFDSLYVVKANPESLAHELFREDRRARVVECVRAIGRRVSPLIDLSRGRLLVSVGEPLSGLDELRRLVRTASDLAGFILGLELSPSILWQAATSRRGQCPVCGSALAQGIVRCGKCRTPHHRECWEYARTCSTYACGGTSFD